MLTGSESLGAICSSQALTFAGAGTNDVALRPRLALQRAEANASRRAFLIIELDVPARRLTGALVEASLRSRTTSYSDSWDGNPVTSTVAVTV